MWGERLSLPRKSEWFHTQSIQPARSSQKTEALVSRRFRGPIYKGRMVYGVLHIKSIRKSSALQSVAGMRLVDHMHSIHHLIPLSPPAALAIEIFIPGLFR